LVAIQRQLDEVTRAVGRPSDQVQDINGNVIHMPGAANPVIAGRDQDVGISFSNGQATITDGTGRSSKPLTAQQFNGPVVGDTHGVHHGDVGISGSEFYNHYGDLHGNSYGFHYGPVGDGTTQNQINALNVFATGFFGNVGIPGQNWTLYGTVVAPSEQAMKTDIQPLLEAGSIIDQVPSFRWRWHPDFEHADEHEHAGPMAEDVESVAPWLVRKDPDNESAPRMLSDRDLIGVLWSALKDARTRIAALERKVKP
jgi:hypothetical protein